MRYAVIHSSNDTIENIVFVTESKYDALAYAEFHNEQGELFDTSDTYTVYKMCPL